MEKQPHFFYQETKNGRVNLAEPSQEVSQFFAKTPQIRSKKK